MNRINILYLACLILISSCNQQPNAEKSPYLKTPEQTAIFNSLASIVDNNLLSKKETDSTAFLVLPLVASCPSCREKVIDSIIKYGNRLQKEQYIIISARSGYRTMNSYFKERNGVLPVNDHIILDTLNITAKNNLQENNPTIYYAAGRRVYLKVNTIPSTIKKDLEEYFSDN